MWTMYADDDIKALMEEVRAGNLQGVTDMLAAGVSADAADYFKVRPLHIAATQGHLEMVKLLIAHGCDVNAQSACPSVSEQEDELQAFLEARLARPIAAVTSRCYAEYAKYNENNFGVSPLHLAAQYGHLHVVKTLVSAKANVNVEDSVKETPLFSAVAHSCQAVAAYLIQKGAVVNARNLDGSTPLHCAAERANVKVTKLLIKNKAAINAKDVKGLTPLHMSILGRKGTVSQFLINNGADVNATDDDGRTPLFTGAKSGYPAETASLLIAKGASVNARDKSGRTPLHLAAENEYADIAYILINNKARINATDDLMLTPLHNAAYKGNLDMVNGIFVMGAKVNARTHKQATPLHFAADRCHVAVVISLLSTGAEVNAVDHKNWTALHFAADETSTRHNLGQSQHSKLKTIEALIAHGADVNAKGSTDETALHVAVKYSDRAVATFLLENGAYCDVRNSSYFGSSTDLDMTAIARNANVNALLGATEKLFQAVKKADSAEIKKSLQEGAPVNSRSKKHGTPLLYASWKGHLAVVRVLLENGADVNLGNGNGETPLHYAAKFGHYELLCVLLQHGAVYNARTTTGEKTPLHFAQEGGNKVIAGTLELIERIFVRVNLKDNTVLKDLNELKDIKHDEFLALKSCKNVNKETMTQTASNNGYEELCKLFCEL